MDFGGRLSMGGLRSDGDGVTLASRIDGVESRENGGRIHDGHPMAWGRLDSGTGLACLLTGKKYKRMSEQIFGKRP